jgi:Biopolymer transport proteins
MSNTLTTLTDIFYLISHAILIPVMLGLIFGLVVALLLLGCMLREWIDRLSFQNERKKLTMQFNTLVPDTLSVSKNGGVFADALNLLYSQTSDSLFISKIVADAEIYWQERLEKIQTWIRTGPALGLMGTLIPLGPGLIALADGDLKTLSANLIIAFATTVVGILIALICGGVHSIRKRWYRADSVLLTYVAERLAEQLVKGEKSGC